MRVLLVSKKYKMAGKSGRKSVFVTKENLRFKQ